MFPLSLLKLINLLIILMMQIVISSSEFDEQVKLSPPVIDVSALFMLDPPRNDVIKLHHSIRIAVHKWGFFNIINHNIDPQLEKDMVAEMKIFFQSSDNIKNSVRRSMSNSRGFTDSEYTKQQIDIKQIFDVGHKPFPHLADNAADNIVLDGFNQYPIALPNFRQVVELYYEECKKLAAVLLRAIIKSINLPMNDDYFDQLFTNHTSFLRLNYYPIFNNSHPSNLDKLEFFGVSRHTDAGMLTILRQDVAGLEVYSGTKEDIGDGVWSPVDPISGALTINIGDMFQVLSNNKVSAPEHRVRASRVESRVRYSAPFFYNPAYSAQIVPLILQSSNDLPLYQPINWGHFRKQRFAGDYSDIGREIQIEDFLITEIGIQTERLTEIKMETETRYEQDL